MWRRQMTCRLTGVLFSWFSSYVNERRLHACSSGVSEYKLGVLQDSSFWPFAVRAIMVDTIHCCPILYINNTQVYGTYPLRGATEL